MWPFKQPELFILVVCTANICRSPAAELLLQQHLRRAGLRRKVTVESAGTAVGSPGAPVDPRVVSILSEQGINAKGGRAAPITAGVLRKADFVWTMETEHLNAIHEHFADATGQLELLDPDGLEIPDPYFGDKAGVRAVVERLDGIASRRAQQVAALLADESQMIPRE